MAINWDTVLKLVSGVLAALAGWALSRWSERRPRLIAYYGHASALRWPPPPGHPPDQPPPSVHTHSVVIRNVGRRAATNVRVSHYVLPEAFTVWPPVPFLLEEVAGAGRDILIATLVPDQQVTINYLYFPPLTFDTVTSGVRSDEGFARVVTALPTPQPSRKVLWAMRALMLIGVVTVLYLALVGGAAIVRAWGPLTA